MPKNYTDELATWVKKRATKRRQDAATIAFLAVRADVKTAIDSGYAVTTIYEHMQETGRIQCSYETFRKHVQRHIKAEAKQIPTSLSKPPTTPPSPPEATGFKFRPTPNKEELL